MGGAAIFAAISFLGMIAAVAWIACVSLAIRRSERYGLRTAAGNSGSLATPPSRAHRLARRATGARWI